MTKQKQYDQTQQQQHKGQPGQEQQPPRKMTVNVRGQNRAYNYVKTVDSMEELEHFRFTHFCVFNGSICIKRLRDVAKSFIMPCKWKKFGKRCEFELRAVRPTLESGTIHVYAHSEHSHPIRSEDKRAAIRKTTKLMPAENPPTNFRTPDSIEWQFVQTCPDFDQFVKFARKNHSPATPYHKNRMRIRLYCHGMYTRKCKFMLLAFKTTEHGYHVYTHGEHKHNNRKPMRKWFGNKQEEEMPEENPPPIIRTPDGIEWQFLKTFSDFDQINKFRHKHQCQATKDKKDSLRIRFYCRRRNKDDCKCKFTLMALKTHNGGYHVYKHGEHGNHPTLIRRLYRSRKNVDEEEVIEDDEVEEEDEEENEDEEDEDEEDEMTGEEEDDEVGEEEEEDEKDEEDEEDEMKEEEEVEDEIREVGEGDDEEIEDEEEESRGEDTDYVEIEKEQQQQQQEDESPTDTVEEVQNETQHEDDIIWGWDEELQEEEEEEAAFVNDIQLNQNPLLLDNVHQHQPPQPRSKEIHEFHNVGAWLRRKR